MNNLDYSVYIQPQEHSAITPPPGKKAFLVETVDEVEEEHGYAGFFGPSDLLDNLTTEQAQSRLASWIAYAVVSEEDRTDDIQNAEAVLQELVEGREAYVRTGSASQPGELLFPWSEQQSLKYLAKRAVNELRALELDTQLPPPSRKSAGPRF